MGEWKRIYCSSRRLFALGLLTVLTVLFFFIGKMTYFGPGSAEILVKSERYYADLVERARAMTEDEIRSILDDEERRLDDYYWWRSFGYEDHQSVPFEQFELEVAEHGLLSSLSSMSDEEAVRAVLSAEERVAELREQLDYVSGYADYLDTVQKQAQLQSMTSVFGNKGSFSHKNIVKTAEEFDTLRGVEAEFGANRAYEGWIGYELADYIYLFVIIQFVFAFTEERRGGLSGVIRSCRYGRCRLGLHRVLILASASALGVVLIYGVNLLFSVLLSGDFSDMGRSIQSLRCFRTLIQHTTIGGWLVQYLLVKAASGFTIGLFLWSILGSITNVQYSIAVLGAVIAGEYVLFSFLPVQSTFNMIKYFNLFSYIRTSRLYTDYLNINLFGYPYGIRNLALFPLPVFAVVLFFAVMITAWKRRPEGHRDLLSRVVGIWDTMMDKGRCRLSVGGWEAYKTLVFERCVFILAVVIIAGGSLDFVRAVKVDSNSNMWYQAYLYDMQGPISAATDDYIENALKDAANDPNRLSALYMVEARVAGLRERAEAGGYEPWIASDIAYRAIYGPDAVDAQRVNAAVSMVFVIALCAAMVPFEHKSGVVYMLRSLKKGRGGIFQRKALMAAAMTTAAFGSVYVREYMALTSYFGGVELATPMRNLDCFNTSPFNLTTGQYLLILYAVRYLMLLAFAFAVMFASSYIRAVETSYIVLMLLFGIPALLYSLGVSVLGIVSPVRAVSAAEYVWSFGEGSTAAFLPLMIWLAAGVAALILCRFKWCTNGQKHLHFHIAKTKEGTT